jgi:hypothetical protein
LLLRRQHIINHGCILLPHLVPLRVVNGVQVIASAPLEPLKLLSPIIIKRAQLANLILAQIKLSPNSGIIERIVPHVLAV